MRDCSGFSQIRSQMCSQNLLIHLAIMSYDLHHAILKLLYKQARSQKILMGVLFGRNVDILLLQPRVVEEINK